SSPAFLKLPMFAMSRTPISRTAPCGLDGAGRPGANDAAAKPGAKRRTAKVVFLASRGMGVSGVPARLRVGWKVQGKKVRDAVAASQARRSRYPAKPPSTRPKGRLEDEDGAGRTRLRFRSRGRASIADAAFG